MFKPALIAAAAAVALATTAPATIALAQTASAHDHSSHAAARPTIESSIKDLLANPDTAAVVEKHLPGVSQHPARPQFEGMTLAQVAPVSNGAVTAEIIAAIDADLKALPGH
jgi:hypothetical protein|tara:strand:+ start:759 stop:1094 length:336 start_codon:yes stop_codon:yes gene_type:complete